MEYIINFLKNDFKGIWYVLYLVFAIITISKLIKNILKNLDVDLTTNSDFMGSSNENYEAEDLNKYERENQPKTASKENTLIIK